MSLVSHSAQPNNCQKPSESSFFVDQWWAKPMNLSHHVINQKGLKMSAAETQSFAPTLHATLVSLCESFSALLKTLRSSSSDRVAPGSFCWSGSMNSFSLAGWSKWWSMKINFLLFYTEEKQISMKRNKLPEIDWAQLANTLNVVSFFLFFSRALLLARSDSTSHSVMSSIQ